MRREDYFPAGWESGIYQGKMFHLPEMINSTILYYNKDLFDEVGLDVNAPYNYRRTRRLRRSYQSTGTRWKLFVNGICAMVYSGKSIFLDLGLWGNSVELR